MSENQKKNLVVVALGAFLLLAGLGLGYMILAGRAFNTFGSWSFAGGLALTGLSLLGVFIRRAYIEWLDIDPKWYR